MILVETTLGNLSDPLWQQRARGAAVDLLVLEQWEAPKNRLRKASEGGVELAISLPRSEHLHDGDVLHYDEAAGIIVAARIALKDVLVIELEGLEKLSPTEILRTCFELGHGLGNQHWPAVIKGSTVYVPLSVDQKVMASVMRTHAFEHVKTRFAPGEEIAAKLDAREVRLLFAGADATPHHHHGAHGSAATQADAHSHAHSHSHSHSHSHGHEHGHAHSHVHDHVHAHDHDHTHGHDHDHDHHHHDHDHDHAHGHSHGHSHSHGPAKSPVKG
ncbi:urease accessory protein UreE [Xanthobacter tagetidis]|uniref:Urease accessory protein UreE n=1 Tax=Xanthobacter tagetidis TaxID=60216 RepID=A0A3L7A415_9HYPH|nr:urease accessory protein UreE [Xanthobacter tagetidis]MBB6307183.1 urease accessory protein [Xanthobacter tagetidis]RLP74022.1 urease accessory protein UreE [Xanthobacter tagetidis]